MLWNEFVDRTPGMTKARMEKRTEPLRRPCPSVKHPGVSALYLDHPSWYEAAELLGVKGKRFLTPSGKVEVYTAELDRQLATAGHRALPIFYTHPEVTGAHPTIAYESGFVTNPVNPQAVTHPVRLGLPGNDDVHRPNTFGPAQQVGDQRYEAANTLVDDRLYDNLSDQQAYKCFAKASTP